MCQVGPVNGRLEPFGEVARRPPLPFSSQIALSPKSSNRSRSPSDPRMPPGPINARSPLMFPRTKSVRVVMTSSPSRLHTHDERTHGRGQLEANSLPGLPVAPPRLYLARPPAAFGRVEFRTGVVLAGCERDEMQCDR